MRKLLSSIVIAATLSNCSYVPDWAWSNASEPQTQDIVTDSNAAYNFDALELFLARNSMHQTDFEHYKIDGQQLFHECGEIRQGRFFPRKQQIIQIPWPQRSSLAAELASFMQQQTAELPHPGKLDAFYDPGQLTLKVQSSAKLHTTKTSLDSVVPAKNETTRSLRAIVEEVRGSTQPLCGSPEFYGVGRKS